MDMNWETSSIQTRRCPVLVGQARGWGTGSIRHQLRSRDLITRARPGSRPRAWMIEIEHAKWDPYLSTPELLCRNLGALIAQKARKATRYMKISVPSVKGGIKKARTSFSNVDYYYQIEIGMFARLPALMTSTSPRFSTDEQGRGRK